MGSYLVPAYGDDIPSNKKGLEHALSLAQQHAVELVIFAPSIANAKDSNILSALLTSSVLSKMAAQREPCLIQGVNVRIEALSTFRGARLNAFSGVILGLWLSAADAATLSQGANCAKEVILVQWGKDELANWAQVNNATLL
ncbi:hypothetical protein A8A09_05735 [Klebsiella variicola]|uniref:hypothetical protein n=1 Tax=Klebsiella variicola TaxID=244366 RepID=UPI000B9454B8|nr:hypothetical protein [Klebsiella variicola]OYD18837.1 hypothetical protein A8A09_05735 [Klebsiella variicola]